MTEVMRHQLGQAYSPHGNGESIGARRMKSNNEMIYIPAKSMKITWGQNPRFWKWIQLPRDKLPRDIPKAESGFASVAELMQVNWLEVTGSVDLANQPQLSASMTYEVVFHIKFRVDAFGWSRSPVTLWVVGPGGRKETRSVMMETYRSRAEVWHEIHGGEFKLSPGGARNSNKKVEFGMLDVKSQGWKGGMVFAGVTIRPAIQSQSQALQSKNNTQMVPSYRAPSSRSWAFFKKKI